MIHQGDPLLSLRSPELEARLALAMAREQQLQWQVAQQPFDARLREAGPALRKRWQAAQAEVGGLQREVQRLNVAMPFDGRVVDTSPDIMRGSWVTAGEALLTVISPGGAKVEAFVDEAGLQRLDAGSRGVFIPDAPERPSIACTRAAVDAVQLGQLDQPGVASVYGGRIPAHRDAQGRVLPLQPTFRIRLDGCDAAEAPASEVFGIAVLHGERHSLANQAWRALASLWHREAGF